MKLRVWSSFVVLALLLMACNVTKYVPDGEFLLDKTDIKTDTKDLDKTELLEYLRQTPNAAVFGAWRMQLGIYNLAPKDTSTSFNRFWHRTFKKIGDPPVIYNSTLTSISVHQLQRLAENKGYINARVESKLETKGKKARVEYIVTSNKPYRLRDYNVNIKNEQLTEIAADTSRSLIRPDMLFDADVFNAERERVTSLFRKQGFYNFNKDYLTFSADSTLNSHKIDVTLELRDYLRHSSDSVNKIIFKQYSIRKVIYYINKEASLSADIADKDKLDTVQFRDFILITPKDRILKLDALVQNTFINPSTLYSDNAVERTYQSLNSLGPIKYVNISFKESDSNLLDCYIIIVPSKTVSLSTELEATYTDGFWGGATSINIVNRNQFKGAETLSVQLRGAFEKQDSTIWAQEFGIQAGLKFPRVLLPFGSYDFKRNIHANTEFTSSLSFMNRPGEFTTTNAGAGINYSWNRQQFHHVLQLFDLNYVRFLNVDPVFRSTYLNETTPKYNPYNYRDHLIMRMGYTGSFSTFNPNRPLKNYSSVRYSVESAGNFLYAMSNLLGGTKVEGAYQLFKVRYSQYVKGEYNITHHQIYDNENRFVYHLGVGLGVPYGNANVIPYEKRFYSGGANSVRGWGESKLGPGTYKRFNSKARDFNQVGDIKLDMNMEYRAKLAWLAEGALFLNAGNIWTIKNYETQPLGQFKLDSFMQQIAIAYGAGLRFNFSFFIARIDMGIKLYDPVLSRTERWRVNPKFSDDVAFHFAIGYPF
ncbi:MAG: BamA/TamA family outer membrane protein [Paludibacter sp.]